MRSGARSLLALAWLLAACSTPARDEEDAAGRLRGSAAGWNLLLLSVDTVRADRLGAWGYEVRDTSPHLDRLAASGVRFERTLAPRASTWPSLATVLTGLYPSGHGVTVNGYKLPAGLPTLPLLLREAGYATGAFLGNMCQAGHAGWDARYCAQGVDGRVVERGLAWADTLDGERPFFLWAHFFGAHPPYYNGGQRAARKLDPGYQGIISPARRALDDVMRRRIPLDEADIRHLDAVYDAAVMGTDRLAGLLLDGLRERGLLERTVIVFLADHGEDLYDHHGYLYHACSVYQSALHVPLVFAAPGLLPVAAVAPPVELTDVAPTVLELLGVGGPAGLHGKSLVPYLERPRGGGAGRPAFSEYGATRVRTVLAGHWTLVDNPDRHRPLCFDDAPPDLYPLAEVELYDLRSDPGERLNLAAGNPEKVAELRDLIRRRFQGLEGGAPEQEVPEELKEELRALGYVAD